MWGVHGDTYRFSPVRPPGKIIIAEGTSIQQIQGSTYDFILSSHNLEHFANPVKALLEWKRITRPEGALILVLPHFEQTFDHRRKPTPVDHMVDDYSRDVGEDDPTHMAEVIELHDLSIDGFLKTGTLEEFRLRCANNFANRSMHHHVFDEVNSRELLVRVGLEVLAIERSLPYHIIILAQWRG